MKALPVAALVVGLGSACAHQAVVPAPSTCDEPRPEASPPTLPRSRPYHLIDGATGVAVTDAEWGHKLRSATLVFVGEQHDNAAHHAFQLDVLTRAHHEDANSAVALEMLPHAMQDSLTAFVEGKINEPTFAQAVNWKQTWGYPLGLYSPLLTFARAHGLPAFALNAPRALVRAVYKGGLAALSPQQTQQLPQMQPGPAAHREFARQAFASHATARFADQKFEAFYEAQLLWDETMAERLVAHAKAAGGPSHIIVIAGEGHTRRFAVPARAARRGVDSALLVLAVEADEAQAAQADKVADVLAVFDPESAPPPQNHDREHAN